MNILPKKSWHVRTKKNIERVRQDEARAEELAKIEQQRVLVAEQEARINYLRSRLGLTSSSEASSTTVTDSQTDSRILRGHDGHINLFDSAKDHQTSTNDEQELEKKREEILWQSKVGILNRLGGHSTNVAYPWYIQDHEKRMGIASNARESYQATYKQIDHPKKAQDVQNVHDPLIIMKNAQRIIKDKCAFDECSIKPSSAKLNDKKSSPTIIDLVEEYQTEPISAVKLDRKNRDRKRSHKDKRYNSSGSSSISEKCDSSSRRKSKHKKSKRSKHKREKHKRRTSSHRTR